MSLTISVIIIVYFTAVFLLRYGVRSFFFGGDTKCYGDLGCFSSGPPFKSLSRPISTVPSSPDHIRTLFILYTRDNPHKGQELDARKYTEVKPTWTKFGTRQTKFIVHGFLDDIHIVSWLDEMKTELLNHDDFNVIIVDWHHGNLLPYTQATANTRVVGAQIAVLIHQLQKDFAVDPDGIHIIGHSLGAHIAGYAGERVLGLGRISGLDPAGPYFSGTDKVVHLDSSDALLVDTIHSDGLNILQLGLGMKEAVGHMDFYPNLGHDQPGCKRDILNLLDIFLKEGLTDMVACNHLRSIKFFTESINSQCPFMAIPCENEDDFKENKCQHCSKDNNCASMGFKANEKKPAEGTRVKYYTLTAKDAPFCQYLLGVKIRLAKLPDESYERGTIMIRLYGQKGVSNWLHLDEDPVYYYSGVSYKRTVATSQDLGLLSHVDFKWHHESSLTNPFKWNMFGLRSPKLYLHGVDIVKIDEGTMERFCTYDFGVENNEAFSLFHPCK